MKYVPVSNKSGSYDSAKPDMETNKEIQDICIHHKGTPCFRDALLERHILAQAEARGAEKERERCARVVENWHISKGGYGNMANFIRENQTPDHE